MNSTSFIRPSLSSNWYLVAKSLFLFLILEACVVNSTALYAQLPEGFEMVSISTDDETPLGTVFVNDSLFYFWKCDGSVWAVLNDEVQSEPVIDIWEEVGCWGDNGLLGLVLDPSFDSNGYIYLLYHVDLYHELYKDSASYSAFTSWNYNAAFGRVTRFTIDAPDFMHSDPSSRHVILGQTIDQGIPEMTSSHSVGSLVFGSDNTLIISNGDGSTWWGHHNGGAPYPNYTYDSLGVALGIMTPQEDVGAFRAQYLNSLNGKLLRIDPATGLGVPSNPYYDAEAPNAPRSKIWSRGLRNPFRICHRPFTGSSNPDDGQPGDFIVSDVGHYTWEEINYCDGPGQNFGWPIFEGMEIYPDYFSLDTQHPDFDNSLYDGSGCEEENFLFQNLLIQENEQHDYHWSNPCDALISIPDSVDRSTHTRPKLAYINNVVGTGPEVHLPGFSSSGEAAGISLAGQSDVIGEPFGGIASIGGTFYAGTQFPEEYFGAYFQSDYSGWTRTFWFDEENEVSKIEQFSNEIGTIVHTAFNPYDECLYFSSYLPAGIKRVCFEGNVRPIVIAEADVYYGPAPLNVQFTSSDSYDPDEDSISFYWDFDDGSTDSIANPAHVFEAASSAPEVFDVTVFVTDTAGNVGEEQLLISVNNTPPQVEITSIEDGELYSLTGSTNLYDLAATVSDAEHDSDQLSYKWELVLHHNTHIHISDSELDISGQFLLEGVGCLPNEDYYYSVRLNVTDAHGLSGSDEVFLYANCDEAEVPAQNFETMTAYPNPSDGNITIRGPLELDTDYDLSVYSADGRLIMNNTVYVGSVARLSVALPNEGQRFYLVRVQGPGVNWTEKVFLFRE